jgi:hypothetical protein
MRFNLTLKVTVQQRCHVWGCQVCAAKRLEAVWWTGERVEVHN